MLLIKFGKKIILAVMKCAQEISIAQDLLFWLIPKHKEMITFKKHQKIISGSS